ncbi:hypothetical protein B0H13DRAFT_2448054 [Mycena leptocephala]|nr:hypothetical protein B0H13DRAFT_2383832 [Mycena leptocephala]KAJ7916033.1 hypothetical protein B0H13DRAFT_1871486 [Mycena leptocephala]KAJ7936387.1 hypothetical protein B0H13DRAFT_2448054 [Mycena leptocephala]
MSGTPILNAAQMVQAQVLRDRLNQEMAARNLTNPNDAFDATRLDGPSPENSLTGTVRSRDDAEDDGLPNSLADLNAPYTLEEGRALKRHKNLSGQSDNDAEMFLKACLLLSSTYNPMRHLFQVHLVALQCRDILNTIKADGDNKYKLSDILQKTCQDYAHCALLASNAKNYRNIKEQPTIAAVIVGVMRALGISDLPLAMETGRVEVLIKFLSKALTTKRNHIKTQIVSSIKDKVDIATLTRACIGTSPAVPTAAVYLRIALIRSIVVELNKTGSTSVGAGDEPKDDSKDKFWPEVDKNIAIYYQTMNPAERQIMFEAIYREDIVSYGEPDNKIPLTLMQDVEGWLTTLNKAMEK